jgi:hypothetical protein
MVDGRRCFILHEGTFAATQETDADPAGLKAAARWTRTLRAAGAGVDAFHLPPGIKDPGPLLGSTVARHAILERIFTP